jgi:hypothetical protein
VVAAFVLRGLALVGYILGVLWIATNFALLGMAMDNAANGFRYALFSLLTGWLQPLGVLAASALLHAVGEAALALREIARTTARDKG